MNRLDGTGYIFRISRVEKINFQPKNGQPPYDRWTLTFAGDRGLPLNTTNLRLMVKFFGKHYRAWIGQQATVYRDEGISFGGRLTGGLRVRKPEPQDVPSPSAPSGDSMPF